MNKYTELSDFEINLLVAQFVLPETQYDVIKKTMDIIQFLVDGSFSYRFFNPCLNPDQAVPIIIENKITLSPRYLSDDCISKSFFYHDIYSVNKNPLRAAMEVFLMMKDEENNND